jgi:hypothetical protein
MLKRFAHTTALVASVLGAWVMPSGANQINPVNFGSITPNGGEQDFFPSDSVLNAFNDIYEFTLDSGEHYGVSLSVTTGLNATSPISPSGWTAELFSGTPVGTAIPPIYTTSGATLSFANVILQGGSSYYIDLVGTGTGKNSNYSGLLSIDPLPIPGALPLFATGLGLLGFLAWRKMRRSQPELGSTSLKAAAC